MNISKTNFADLVLVTTKFLMLGFSTTWSCKKS